MKKTVLLLALAFLSCTLGAVSPLPLPRRSLSVASAGLAEDALANPAALPFRASSEGSFLLSVAYADDTSPSLLASAAPLGFLNSPHSAVSLSFGGSNAMLTGAIGFDLENRKESGGTLSYDFLFSMHFQLDLGFNIGPFSAGARLKGGSSLIRAERAVDGLLELGANMFLSEYSQNPGSEYFQMGLGLMWHDEDWFTVGLYCDDFVGTHGGRTSLSLDNMLSSLSAGVSVYLPRFDEDGDLKLLRPSFTLQFGDIMSTESYILATALVSFQLLPQYTVSVSTSVLSLRDATAGWLHAYENLSIWSLELILDKWAFQISAQLPFSYFTGGTMEKPFRLDMALRFKP